MLTFLLSKGANISAFVFQMRDPLVIAVTKNNAQAVSVLLKYGREKYNKTEVSESDFNFERYFCFLWEEALNINNPIIIKMLTDNVKRKNQISLSLPVAIRKKNIMRKLLNIFLTEIKSDDSRGPLWTDFIEIYKLRFTKTTCQDSKIQLPEEKISTFIQFSGVFHQLKTERRYCLHSMKITCDFVLWTCPPCVIIYLQLKC